MFGLGSGKKRERLRREGLRGSARLMGAFKLSSRGGSWVAKGTVRVLAPDGARYDVKTRVWFPKRLVDEVGRGFEFPVLIDPDSPENIAYDEERGAAG